MRLHRLVLAALAALALTATPALAADFGVRGGLYTEIDKPFVGIEILSKVGNRIYFNPNVEYVFVDEAKFGTFNFDAHYDLPTGDSPYVWIGAGLAFLYSNPDGPGDSNTDAHANLLAGIGFRTRGGTVPYIQLKLITTDPKEFVVAAGVRF